MYQMQAAAAAAVGGRRLNMPRGAAVKPVSRFQGPNKHIQAADTAVTSRLARPSPPRAAGRGNLAMPREREGAGGRAVPVRGTTTNNMSGLTQPAPPLHDNDSNTTASAAAWRAKLYQTWKRSGRLKSLKTISICCIWKISIKARVKDCDWRGAAGRENLTFPAEKQQNF